MPGKSPNLKIFKIGLYRLPSICPDNDPGNGWEEVILVWGQLPSVATQSHRGVGSEGGREAVRSCLSLFLKKPFQCS